MSDVTFKMANLGPHETLKAYIGDKCVGTLEFEIKDEVPYLISVVVDENYRRRKVATEMLKYVQNKYGDIIWNGRTPDGESLYKSFYKN
jgi:ribosomal protein S18 acetylase RimI-like enzyme